ncbi:MAG: DciA family protein [Methylococcales bacterium]|nr:DciA family protein [Methylococcales bacterium]
MIAPKKEHFKTIKTYNNRILANYQRKINQQNHLLMLVKKPLPDLMAKHLLYCVVLNKKLHIYTDSAAWSSQLRFYQQAMLEAIVNAKITQISSLKIQLIPSIHKPKKNQHSLKKTPSKRNIELLDYCSESIHDKKLKQSLVNLSQTLKKLLPKTNA